MQISNVLSCSVQAWTLNEIVYDRLQLDLREPTNYCTRSVQYCRRVSRNKTCMIQSPGPSINLSVLESGNENRIVYSVSETSPKGKRKISLREKQVVGIAETARISVHQGASIG